MSSGPQRDEAAIRALIAEWIQASSEGRHERVLELMGLLRGIPAPGGSKRAG